MYRFRIKRLSVIHRRPPHTAKRNLFPTKTTNHQLSFTPPSKSKSKTNILFQRSEIISRHKMFAEKIDQLTAILEKQELDVGIF